MLPARPFTFFAGGRQASGGVAERCSGTDALRCQREDCIRDIPS